MPPTVPPVASAAQAVTARSVSTWRVVTLTLCCSIFTPMFLGAFHQRIATGVCPVADEAAINSGKTQALIASVYCAPWHAP